MEIPIQSLHDRRPAEGTIRGDVTPAPFDLYPLMLSELQRGPKPVAGKRRKTEQSAVDGSLPAASPIAPDAGRRTTAMAFTPVSSNVSTPQQSGCIRADTFWSHFCSVITRHGHNPLDPRWQNIKHLCALVFLEMESMNAAPTPAGACAPPPILPFVPPPIRPTFVTPPIPSDPHAKAVFISQARIFSITLTRVPVNASITVRITNVGGIMPGQDVTEYFVSRPVVVAEPHASGHEYRATWKIHSELSTSRLPYAIKQINQMDKQAMHRITFSLADGGETRQWPSYFVVRGRGGNYSGPVLKCAERGWDELVPVAQPQSANGASDPIRAEAAPAEADRGATQSAGKRKREADREDSDTEEETEELLIVEEDEDISDEGPGARATAAATDGTDAVCAPAKGDAIEAGDLSQPIGESTGDASSNPPTLSLPPLALTQAVQLHLSIQLIDLARKAPVSWGAVVRHGTSLAIVINNPDTVKAVRVVCHLCDRSQKRMPFTGKSVLDLRPKESAVVCRFDANAENAPVHIYVMGACLPLTAGQAIYMTRLFLNIDAGGEVHPPHPPDPPKADEQKKKHFK